MIRVAVAAAGAVARAGLAAVVSGAPALELVATLPLGEARAPVSADVVVAELPPDEPGWEERAGAWADALAPAALVLLADAPDETLATLVRAGVRGVLPRAASPEAIVAALVCASAGLAVFDAGLVAAAAPARAGLSRGGGGVPALTPREQEVLALLAEGLGNKQVAARLGISEHTVKTHVTALYEKLGASTRAEAVIAGARRGLIML